MIDKMIRVGLDIFNFTKVRRCSYNELYKLKSLQYSPKKKLENMVENKIKAMVKHAFRFVPFYNELYHKLDVNINDVKGKDLRNLPITTKTMFRSAYPDNVIARGCKSRAIYNRTSGSTGEPFEFFNDTYANPLHKSSYMLFNTWMGVGANDKHVHIVSPEHFTRKSILRDHVYGKYQIPSLEINRNAIRGVVERINKVNPKYIECYAASLHNTARFINDMSLDLKCKPRGIISTSEDLIENRRKFIEDVFQSKIYNRYGSREFSGAVAQECGICDGLHVNTASCFIEIVDENGDPVGEGERGKVLVTDLNNHVMPFIRYDLGDSAIQGPEKSECGRTFPLIRGIMGREGQFILSNSGQKIPFITIASYLFKVYAPHVYNYQFVQQRKGEIILKIVPTEKFDKKVMDGINIYLNKILKNFSISVRLVDDISPAKSGKKPFLITFRN